MKKRLSVVCALILIVLISACSPAGVPQATPTQPTAATQPAVEAATATSAPSPTPAASKVLLIASPGSGAVQDSGAQPLVSAVTELAAQSGLTLETRPELQQSDLTPEIKLVVLPNAPANLAELVGVVPQTQFIAVSGTDLPAAGNLSVIRERWDYQAFVAGFISTLLSTNYRAAGLLPADGPQGATLKDAFINGGRYFCGVCAPGWPLKVYYPVVADLPSATDGPAWQAAAAGFFDNQKVEVFYISPEANRAEVAAYVTGRVQFETPVVLLGAQIPPDALRPQWAASVRFDDVTALKQVWQDVTTGKGGAVVEAPLVVDNINAELLGEGRQRLVNNLLADLKAGQIFPLTVPPQ